MGCLHKILAKLFANRLRKVLDKVIDHRQNVFLCGRQLFHSVMVTNEVIDEAKRRKKSCIFFKVDFEKSYNSVSWEFLACMLKRLDFNDTWVSWIKGCLNSSWSSVLVNGNPTQEVRCSKGLRQGDLLAPFLFLVAAKGLSGLMREANATNSLRGYEVRREKCVISLLQYVDDTIFVGEANARNEFTIKVILRMFKLASDLKVYFFKSSFRAIAVGSEEVERFANLLNCRVLSFPCTYLGLPLGDNPMKVATWNPIIDKFKKRLATWKHKQIVFRR